MHELVPTLQPGRDVEERRSPAVIKGDMEGYHNLIHNLNNSSFILKGGQSLGPFG